MKKDKTVDDYLAKKEEWSEALALLRSILLEMELEETVKWGAPVYTSEGKNIVGIGAFKSYVGLWFFQGALLKDSAGKLMNAQEEKTKAMRQWRFDSLEAIDKKLIKQYVAEAIQNQQAGREIKPAKNQPLNLPDELTAAFAENPTLKKCFDQLSLSRQREFSEYIGEAKRTETRASRLQKSIPLILDKKGLHDKYR